MSFKTATITLLLFATFPAIGFSQAKWLDNVSKAMKQARAQDKDLLLNFTGSDWCHWCEVLEEEVFSDQQFGKKASEEFVFVTLDFPVDQSKQDPWLAKQNHEWMQRLAVDGFPTVVLLDAEGRPYAKTGYQKGGPKPYLAMLNKHVQRRLNRDRLLREATTLQGQAKAKKLDEALSLIDRKIVAQSYKAEVSQVLKHAGDNKKLVARYEALQLLEKQRTALAELEELPISSDKPKILKRIAELEKLFPESSESREEFDFLRIEVLSGAGLHAEAIVVAKEMIAGKPDSYDSQLAREVILENLIALARVDDAVKLAKEWIADKSVDADGKVMLRAYGTQALLAAGRKKEAINFAKEAVAEAKEDATTGVSEDVVDWLQNVVKKKAEVASLDEFLYGNSLTGVVSEYWIGVSVDPTDDGLVVVEVVPDAPAAKAGLKPGDVMQTVNLQPVKSIESLIAVIGEDAPKPLTVVAVRNDKKLEIKVAPVKRPKEAMIATPDFELGPIPEHWERDLNAAAKKAKKENKEVVAFFSAKWCGPCQEMLIESIPHQTVAAELKNRIVVYVEVDTDSGASAAEKYQVDAIPTFLFLSPERKELGRSRGYFDTKDFVSTLQQRGEPEGFAAADSNSDGKLKLGEFKKYIRQRMGDGLPLKKIFQKLDEDTNDRLSPAEFENRLAVIEKFVPKPATETYPDPGRDFVAYPGGANPVDDAKVFGAVIHRYQELLTNSKEWPVIDVAKVPNTIVRPDLSSAVDCNTAADLAKASLIIAGGDESGAGFFTAGAVLVSADGLALTNYHVVEDAADVKLIAMDAQGRVHRVVEVLAGNKERDVALIRIEGEGLHAVKVAAASPTAGDDLVMMHHSEMRFFTYDRGYVMRYARISGEPWMEVSTEYAPGGSGCGIFNKKHELVGLVSSITMGDGPDLASDDSLENEDSELEEWGDDEPVAFGSLVVKHAVPLLAIESLFKKSK
ncbi:MAG: thioredoxin fold domain-containing protein [Planctomycetaceae bacterium]